MCLTKVSPSICTRTSATSFSIGVRCTPPLGTLDRLCDFSHGRGVPNLEDALINMELRPVHDALRRQLDPAIVRLFADRADHPRPIAPETPKKPREGAE